MTAGKDIFITDSILVPICKIAREKRCKFENDSFKTKPDKKVIQR